MSDQVPEHILKNTNDSLQLIYLVYAAGALTLGFTTILGMIWVFLEKDKVDDVLKTHVSFLMQTFWKSWVFLAIGGILSLFLIGFLVLVFWFFWLIIRCVRGFKALKAGQPIEKPKRWGF